MAQQLIVLYTGNLEGNKKTARFMFKNEERCRT
jgi:hypothetical protein